MLSHDVDGDTKIEDEFKKILDQIKEIEEWDGGLTFDEKVDIYSRIGMYIVKNRIWAKIKDGTTLDLKTLMEL